jgi:uncharacterized delta-60 repeat protein
MTKIENTFLLTAFLATVLIFVSADSVAASGELDQTFGTGGISKPERGAGRALAIQPDGKIVIAGHHGCSTGGPILRSSPILLRINPDGSLDGVAGDPCSLVSAVGPTFGYNELAIQPDGKIVAVGWEDPGSGQPRRFIVDKYNTDLSPDTTFNLDGRMQFSIVAGKESEARAVTVDANANIVVAGYTFNAQGNKDIAVVKITPNGLFNFGFGGTGKKVLAFGASSTDDASAVAIDPAVGRIMVGGSIQGTSTGTDFVVLALNPNGSYDTSFGWFGAASIDINGYNNGASAMVVDGSGILIGGYGNHTLTPNQKGIAIAKLTHAGYLDTSFSGDGKLVTSGFLGAKESLASMAVDSAGRIIVAGTYTHTESNPDDNDFLLARFSSAGSLDTSFGSSGRVITNISCWQNQEVLEKDDHGYRTSLQSDGKIVVVGSCGIEPVVNHLLITAARYAP